MTMVEDQAPPLSGETVNLTRRTILRACMGVGATCTAGAMLSALGPLGKAGSTPRGTVAAGEVLTFATGHNQGDPLLATSIASGEGVLAFPTGKTGQDDLVLVIHMPMAEFVPPTNLSWVAHGYVAYSAICTHLGCTVAFAAEPSAAVPYPHIHCPCHQGMFNALAGAKVVSGPPPRALPQLPIAINAEGQVVATGPFAGPVGPRTGGG